MTLYPVPTRWITVAGIVAITAGGLLVVYAAVGRKSKPPDSMTVALAPNNAGKLIDLALTSAVYFGQINTQDIDLVNESGAILDLQAKASCSCTSVSLTHPLLQP